MKIVVVFCFLLLGSYTLIAQADSVSVVFYGSGKVGERFKVYNGSEVILDFKVSGNFKHLCKIPIETNWQYGSDLSLTILRKSRFGLLFKEITQAIYYDPSYKFLAIKRDSRLKSRYALNINWINEIPYVHHLD